MKLTRKEKNSVKENVNFINSVASSDMGNDVKTEMNENIKGALIGGGVGVLIAIASRQNLFMYGIVGLIVGRILFRMNK